MKIRIVNSSDIARCPKTSWSPAHYRDDGSCRCDEREAARADLARCEEALATVVAEARAARDAARERFRST